LELRRLSLVSGARNARGLTVIIDVFRAFTTAAYVMANGAEKIIPTGTVEEAFGLKQLHSDWVIMGERGGKKVEGFEFGNSPFEVSRVDFTGKTVVQTTGAGTKGIVNAKGVDEIILGSFVMAGAITKYIETSMPDVVSLVAMGDNGIKKNEEDEACAEYIAGGIVGKHPPNFKEIERRIRTSPSGAKFFDPIQSQFIEEDFHLSLELNRFDFILRVKRNQTHLVEKHNV
jgi:2-phosphosulfolactate phosphatase